jgi:hypothetical protein
VILENFLQPYLFNGQPTDPGVDVVSFYVDQFPKDDIVRMISSKYNIPYFGSINDALCLGTDQLAVDAVLSIGEHGNYPKNELDQVQYPRKRFFDEIVAVMKKSNRFVPLFNDKHLSYRWDWALEMYDTCRKHGIPFQAGSSVPLAQRRPKLELPKNAEITEAVTVHGGPIESYDFHGLEVLQSMVEARKGGETGIKTVEFWTFEKLKQAAEEKRFSVDLLEAAMHAEFGKKRKSLWKIDGQEEIEPHGIHLTYADGLKATVIRIGLRGGRWNFACRMKGVKTPRATSFYVGPWNNRNLFKALSHAIQQHFVQGESTFPVERTLLTTGILETAMRSRRQNGKSLATPHLEIAYQPKDFRVMREMGKSWEIITEKIPEPLGFDPTGLNASQRD